MILIFSSWVQFLVVSNAVTYINGISDALYIDVVLSLESRSIQRAVKQLKFIVWLAHAAAACIYTTSIFDGHVSGR